jgi:hypothetical protein
MTKKTIKDDLKKEDLFFSTFDKCKAWVSENTKTTVVGVVVVVALFSLGWAYASYLSGKHDSVQSTLAGAIRNYQEYAVSKKADALSKAEAAFKKVEKDGSGGVKDIARLYLAKIAAIQGKKAEAKALYDRVAKSPADQITKKLAETGLQGITKTN